MIAGPKALALLAWWADVPRSVQARARLSPRGAVASSLRLHNELASVRAEFQRNAPRISQRYPEFWRGVQTLLAELEAEASG